MNFLSTHIKIEIYVLVWIKMKLKICMSFYQNVLFYVVLLKILHVHKNLGPDSEIQYIQDPVHLPTGV